MRTYNNDKYKTTMSPMSIYSPLSIFLCPLFLLLSLHISCIIFQTWHNYTHTRSSTKSGSTRRWMHPMRAGETKEGHRGSRGMSTEGCSQRGQKQWQCAAAAKIARAADGAGKACRTVVTKQGRTRANVKAGGGGPSFSKTRQSSCLQGQFRSVLGDITMAGNAADEIGGNTNDNEMD